MKSYLVKSQREQVNGQIWAAQGCRGYFPAQIS